MSKCLSPCAGIYTTLTDPDGRNVTQQLNGDDGADVALDAEPTPPEIPGDDTAVTVPGNTGTKPETAELCGGLESEARLPTVSSRLKTAPPVLPVVDVVDLDWVALRDSINIGGVRCRIGRIISRMENLLDQTAGAGMLFDSDRRCEGDKAI